MKFSFDNTTTFILNNREFNFVIDIKNKDFSQYVFRYRTFDFLDLYEVKNENININLKGIIRKGISNFERHLLTPDVHLAEIEIDKGDNEYICYFILKNKDISKLDFVIQYWFKKNNSIFYFQYLQKVSTDKYNQEWLEKNLSTAAVEKIIVDFVNIKDNSFK
jgi:hypothetical protein